MQWLAGSNAVNCNTRDYCSAAILGLLLRRLPEHRDTMETTCQDLNGNSSLYEHLPHCLESWQAISFGHQNRRQNTNRSHLRWKGVLKERTGLNATGFFQKPFFNQTAGVIRKGLIFKLPPHNNITPGGILRHCACAKFTDYFASPASGPSSLHPDQLR